MALTMQTLTASRLSLTVRVVFDGDTLRDTERPHVGAPVVEFYDRAHDFTPWGQFMGDYFAQVLTQRAAAPLALDLSQPCWTVDASTMDLVSTWLRHQCAADTLARIAAPL